METLLRLLKRLSEMESRLKPPPPAGIPEVATGPANGPPMGDMF